MNPLFGRSTTKHENRVRWTLNSIFELNGGKQFDREDGASVSADSDQWL